MRARRCCQTAIVPWLSTSLLLAVPQIVADAADHLEFLLTSNTPNLVQPIQVGIQAVDAAGVVVRETLAVELTAEAPLHRPEVVVSEIDPSGPALEFVNPMAVPVDLGHWELAVTHPLLPRQRVAFRVPSFRSSLTSRVSVSR